MSGRLEGKVAIVTGGNSGIGEATVHRFAREGAKVAILARREAEGLAVQQAVGTAGGEATFISCDVTDRTSVEAAVAKTVAKYGAIQVLFNNAGGAVSGRFPDETEEGWEATLRVNLTGTFLMTRAVWSHLIEAGGGAVVNMSSMGAVMGVSHPWQVKRAERARQGGFSIPSAYSVAKAGIEAFTRYVAGIGGMYNIRVNCVRPGGILTRQLEALLGAHPEFWEYNEAIQILPGIGRAEDIADTVLFLAAEDSRFITAQVISADGGSTCKV